MVIPRDLPTDPDFARQVEQSEVEAWLDLEPLLPGSRLLEVQPVDGATLVLDQAPEWPHSRILSLGVGKPATPELIQAILRIARDAGVQSLQTDVSPIARPGTLARILAQAGFRQTDRSVVVARHTAGMPEPDSYFRIRLAEPADRETATALMDAVIPSGTDWNILLASQIGRPKWRYYLALEGGTAVGLTGVHIDREVAWLAPMWVRPEFRNRGTQAALIAHAVRDVESLGLPWVTTSYPAAIPGRTRNFERLGFAMVYLRNHFIWEAPQA